MKMNNFVIYVIPFLILFSIVSFVPKQKVFEAVLETQLKNNILIVSSSFLNNSTDYVTYSYRFKSKRVGKTGTSVNQQSGSVKAEAGQKITFSQTSFSVSEGDSYNLHLEILSGNEVIAKETVVFPE